MFGNLVYYNKKKIDQYSALIQGKKYEGSSQEEPSSESIATNYLLECSVFEELLQQRDDFVDFVDNIPDVPIKEVRMSSIIRVKGEIYVPEEFDMIHLINELKPLILSQVECKDNSERNLLNSVFDNSKMKIPVYCELGSECDYWLGIGKISPDNLLIDYNDIEDCEGKDFTILAKLESRKYYKDSPLIVFDIYKDFLGFNRALRKQISSSPKSEFEHIEVEEDYLGLELLAIY